MSDYEVRSDIEPKAARNVARYPLQDLEIGQSIFIPGGDVRRASSAVSYANKYRQGCTMKKFTCRTVIADGVKGVAIIRIAHPVFDTEEYRATLKSSKT